MSEYFSHNYNARNSLALKKITRQYGLEGVGLYWCLIEIFYENEGQIPTDSIADIAFDLRVDESTVEGVISLCDLFELEDGFITAPGVIEQLNIRREKSEKARQNIAKRWEKKTEKNTTVIRPYNVNDTTVIQPEYNRNTIKEKERKENKRKEKENNIYIVEIIDHLNQKAGTNFRANAKDTVSHINARLNDGYTVEQFKQVIDKKCDDWLNDRKMKEFLRPQTLFGSKFESYLNSATAKPIDKTNPDSYRDEDDTAAFLAAYG